MEVWLDFISVEVIRVSIGAAGIIRSCPSVEMICCTSFVRGTWRVMETSQGKEVLKKSPLGCILYHWKETGGPTGGSVNKRMLIKYCNQWWPLYKLDDEEKWPENWNSEL